MNKPKKETRTSYNYHDIIHYIEDKYKIKTRDYAGRSSHFNNWLKLENEISQSLNNVLMVKIDGKLVEKPKEEYDERLESIHKQLQGYQKWEQYLEWEKSNPRPPYLDFWHWLLENDFSDISNGCYRTMYIKNAMDELRKDDWQYEILKLIYNEFNEDEIEVWIEW